MARFLKSHLHNLTRLVRLKDAQDPTRRIEYHCALINIVAVVVAAAVVVLLLVELQPRQSACRRITLG
jgi:hypothetical protein